MNSSSRSSKISSKLYHIKKIMNKRFICQFLFLQVFILKLVTSSKLQSIEQKNIRYIAEIATSHIQSFSTKLIWSGYRQQLLDELAAEEHAKAKKENRKPTEITDASIEEFKSKYHTPGRKILANMISDVLVDSIIRSLVERMNIVDGKFIMKYKDKWMDLKPICNIIIQRNVDTNGNVVEVDANKDNERKEKIECYLDFISIQNILGISLSFTLSMSSELAPEMEQDDIDELLDQKKVPQLVNKSVISTKLILSIPTDFDKSNDNIDDDNVNDQSTMVRTQRKFFDKANQLLVVSKPIQTNIGRSKFVGLDVLEDYEKESFFQNYVLPSGHEDDNGTGVYHDDIEATELRSPSSSSYEEDDNPFDEESFYNGINEDEIRYQEEELLRMEEVKLYESINDDMDNFDDNDVDNVDDDVDDEYESIENFMKQVEEEILQEEEQKQQQQYDEL